MKESSPEPAKDDPPKDIHFDGWRAPRTADARELVDDIRAQVEGYERRYGLRKRNRKGTDQATFATMVAALVTNLARAHFLAAPGVAVPLGHRKLGVRSRYRSPALSQKLPYVIDLMGTRELDLLQKLESLWDRSGGEGRLTTILPSPRFLTKLEEFGVELDALGWNLDQETIVSKDEKERRDKKAKWLPYADTEQTLRWRAELRSINEHLAAADLVLLDPFDKDGRPIGLGDRQLSRHFTKAQWSTGGRLYGGWWQNMSAERRHREIRIDGEPIVEFDFGQMALRLAYGWAKEPPPTGDLYQLDGVDAQGRDRVKVFINAMLFADKALKRKPKREDPDAADPLAHLRAHQLRQMVFERHPKIAHAFERGLGHHLQHLESEVLVALLLRLQGEGITGLPMHDGVMVAESQGPRTKQLMEEVFLELAGVPGVVKEEGGPVAPTTEVEPQVKPQGQPQGPL